MVSRVTASARRTLTASLSGFDVPRQNAIGQPRHDRTGRPMGSLTAMYPGKISGRRSMKVNRPKAYVEYARPSRPVRTIPERPQVYEGGKFMRSWRPSKL